MKHLPEVAFDAGPRRCLVGFGMAAVHFVPRFSQAQLPDDLGIFKAAEAIHQEVLFRARPEQLYHALTDGAAFWLGTPVE